MIVVNLATITRLSGNTLKNYKNKGRARKGEKDPFFSHLLLRLLRLLYTIFFSSEYASLVTELLTESGGFLNKVQDHHRA